MRRLAWLLLLCGCSGIGTGDEKPQVATEPPLPTFRPPAIPLIVQTPYLNVWLTGDTLADDSPKLWNGHVKGMAGLLRIDGKAYRFLGLPGSPLPAMKQEAVRVLPTRTEVEFSQDDVRLKLELLSPMDPRDPRLSSLPLNFIRAEVSASVPRDVRLYLDITGEWAVGSSEQRICWDGKFRIRSSQPRLFKETREYADWGEVHWTAIDSPTAAHNGIDKAVRQAFVDGAAPEPDTRYPRAAKDDWPVFAYVWDLGTVEKPVCRRAILAHVRREAINFFGSPCLSYWTKLYPDAAAMIADAAASCDVIRMRMATLDEEVLSRARAAGGNGLAALAALTFRQSLASSEPALYGNDLFFFQKEISSGSFIQTVDVLYPSAPLFLAFNPALLKMHLAPLFEAVRKGWWHEKFGPHDLGTYPNATGQTYSPDMMVEESANLILLTATLAQQEPAFWKEAQPLLRGWAQYLVDAGFSPEHQLCTDDFAGPQAHNTNLAVKAVLALAALPEFRGEAEARMKRWLDEADAGDHTAMTFGGKDTWSLKYNFFFDRLLNLGQVPEEAVTRELAWYRSKAGRYGIPLDGRKSYTKADWQLWIAAIAPRAEREAIIADLLRFYNETPDRLPATDWYETDSGKRSGFQARPVMGSVFAPVLLHEKAR